ncbi:MULTISPECIES: ABC transporter permease [Paenibacillus]|uniref:ABC transporter permease n=1 Tax=Paenibacillus TaxID=44249 RepID=UPI0022B8E9C3|nr:ABC-2 family transporter protein [Paenibacillus caseinilyticus]MCZ8520442.1 ABC-2 family transporter protein [Paenibacillus caseinilyticus]
MRRWPLYRGMFLLGVQHSMEYRLHFALSLLSSAVPAGVQYFIWTAVYRHSGEGALFSYTYPQMILYTILAGLVARLVETQFEQGIAEDIKNGGLNKYLVQPVSYFGYRLTTFLGQKAVFYLITAGLLAAILSGASAQGVLQLDPIRLLWFAAALFSALLLNFLIAYCLCAIAFYLHDISYFFVITGLLVTILSGGLFPLEIFGETAFRLLQYTPFPYTVYFPVNLLNGKIADGALGPGMAVQWTWIGIFLLGAHLAWRHALKKYVAVGG